jgi:hypothetical protein
MTMDYQSMADQAMHAETVPDDAAILRPIPPEMDARPGHRPGSRGRIRTRLLKVTPELRCMRLAL